MFLFMILFFIIYVVSLICIIYKFTLQDDDIECLYDNYNGYISDSFMRGKKDE